MKFFHLGYYYPRCIILYNDITKNKNGNNTVNIASYTGTNLYIIPEDGYIFVNLAGNASDSGILYLVSSDGYNIGGIGAIKNVSNFSYDCIFVKKGMKVYCTNITGAASVKYYKLI